MLRRCSRVEGWAFQKRFVEIPIRAILRVKAQVLLKIVQIRGLAYGPETSVTSPFGCCARRTIRLFEAEKTESLVSTESDECSPREERYSGGGTNRVYYFCFLFAPSREQRWQ